MFANIVGAVSSWESLLGRDRVITDIEGLSQYTRDTGGGKRSITAVLRPLSVQEVVAIVGIADQNNITLYPISQGKNWGYGSANPVRDGCAIVDLSSMRGISGYDPELGIVSVEPGVTQGQLAQYLKEQGDRYLTPTTGAGPNASILGNAVERGYGLVPIADHFLSVLNMEVVLANGSIYRSAIHAKGCDEVDRIFKWGIGPYIDGIFTQSNLGIVTKVTIALTARPEHIEMFFVELKEYDDIHNAVLIVREVLQELAGITGINIMSDLRLQAMMSQYPFDAIAKSSQGMIPFLKESAKKQGFSAWTCVGSLYGTKNMITAAKNELQRMVRERGYRVTFVSKKKVVFVRSLLSLFPSSILVAWKNRINGLRMGFDILEGRPNEGPLAICYRHLRDGVVKDKDLDPAKDGCGLFWYAPLVPMKPEIVRSYVEFVEKTCEKHGIEPLITLSSLSERCFDSTVPILFDPGDPQQEERAKVCLEALLEGGQKMGVYPYRVGIDMMKTLVDPTQPFWATQEALKKMFDPKGILSPGRYSV